jgi:hypothetical protein
MPLKPDPAQSGTNKRFYIFTIAPYYCENASNGSRDYSSDDTSMNATIFSNTAGDAIEAGNNQGIKMVHGPGDRNNSNSSTVIRHVNTTDDWNPIGASNSADVYGADNVYKSNFWAYGVDPSSETTCGFGPYDLTLTDPTDLDTGSLMLITSGSDILIGSGTGYGSTDTRAFNVLFYVTQSTEADELASQVAGVTIGNSWDNQDRANIYSAGYGMFQTYYDQTPKALRWFPGNYDETLNKHID